MASLAFARGTANAAVQGLATNRPPVQTFYIPLPEGDVLTALQTIHGGAGWVMPSDPVTTYISLAVFVDGTVIYYDQWEDGYEQDLANPNRIYSASNPKGTQIWGDGNPANGYPPNYSNDILHAGDVILLQSSVQTAQSGTETYWDGGDKIGVTKPTAVTRAAWASGSKTMFAGANEVYDTTYFGQEFVCPVGTDTVDQFEVFEYTGLSVMAGPDGATVEIDTDADGAANATNVLKEGETILVNGGVKQGATVKATAGSVQVELLTGDIYDGFESRFIKLLPAGRWSSAYTCPVSTPVSTKTWDSDRGAEWTTSGTKVWLYNPNDTELKVYYQTKKLTERFVTVPAKSAGQVTLRTGSKSRPDYTQADDSGTYFYTKDGTKFYALATMDATGTTRSTLQWLGGSNRSWDWGCALIPDDSLSSQVVVGMGFGRDPTSYERPDENGAPVWVTAPKGDTTIYVDYDGNPLTGARTDAKSNRCDQVIVLTQLNLAKIYNPSGDQTGMLIYTLDGQKFAAAWGADPANSSSGEPGLDMGTGIPPMPEYFMQKSSALVTDADGDGYMTPGDTLEYTIRILNVGRQPVTDLKLSDILPADVTYVTNSLKFTSKAGTSKNIADNDNSFPLAGTGLDLALDANGDNGVLPVGGVWDYTYRATIKSGDDFAYSDRLQNVAVLNGTSAVITNSTSDTVRGRVGDFVWFDANTNGIQDADEPLLVGLTVSLVDLDGEIVRNDRDEPYTQTTGDDGAYLFIGVRPGTYKVAFTVPAGYLPTKKGAGADRALDSDANDDGLTDAFTLRGGETNMTFDAGFIVRADAAAVELVKLAGDAPDGTDYATGQKKAFDYSYRVRNTGYVWLKDLVVKDDKLGAIGTIAGPIAPDQIVTLTTNCSLKATVTNIGTVVGSPCGSAAQALPGFSGTVSDTDDAVVVITNSYPATVGDRVWADLNTNGVQDADEMGVYGVTVNLWLSNQVIVATTKTDAEGAYRFTRVASSEPYTIEFVPGSTWAFTVQNAGSDDELDSDADANGKTAPFTPEPDETNLTFDAGLVKGVPPGICAWIDIADKFNAVIGGDLTTGGGDSEGALLVAGNADLALGYSVGLIGPGYGRTRGPAAVGTDVLVVGGDLSETSSPDMNGNIVYGGAYTNRTSKRLQTSAYTLRSVTPVTLDDAFNVPEDGSGTPVSTVIGKLRTFSAMAAGLPQSEGVVYNHDNDWQRVWTGTNSYRNVFNVSAATFSMASKGIELDVPATSKVLINVTGQFVTETNSGITLPSGMDPGQVLFNFVDATRIETSGFEFPGSVLAPFASASFSGASIDGFAFIGGDVTSTNGFEFHDYAFAAFDCSASPVMTNRPSVKVAITVNGGAAGTVYRGTSGTTLKIVQTVGNTGRTDLKNVVLNDVSGAELSVGTLAAGASASFSTTATLTEDKTFTASATAVPCRADGSAVEGYSDKVTSTGKATVKTATAEELAAIAEAQAAAKGYVPRPDFEVTALVFIEEPTKTGEVFSVKATVKNVGEIAAVPGRIALFLSHPELVTVGETPDKFTDDRQAIGAGSSKDYTFENLTADLVEGAHTLRVFADFNGAAAELSEGNNQLPLFYWLNPIAVGIAMDGTRMTLAWNSFEGQTYSVRASSNLVTFVDYEGTNVLGGSCLNMAATAPTNSVTIDVSGSDDRFFKLSVDAGDPTNVK